MLKQKAQVSEAESGSVAEVSDAPMKTFDGGFFAVSSPVQSPVSSSESSFTFRTFFLSCFFGRFD